MSRLNGLYDYTSDYNYKQEKSLTEEGKFEQAQAEFLETLKPSQLDTSMDPQKGK
jgi:hypothetical protein